MGNKELEARGDGLETCTFSVIAFPANKIPPEYRNVVLANWLRTLRHGNEYFKLIHSDTFFERYQTYIESVLERPGGLLRLAVLTDDHDVVLGWSVTEGSILHYVWVQFEQRNRGLAKALVSQKIMTITHLTKAALRIWNSKLPNAKFNPFV